MSLPASIEIPPTKEELAKEILQVKSTLRLLNRTWNTYIPISQLPDKILYNIFAIVLRVDKWKTRYNFSRACYRWRRVGLAPSLWSEIRFNNHVVDTLISRAGPSDLSVHYRHRGFPRPREGIPKLQSVLETHKDQVVSIKLKGVDDELVSQLFNAPPFEKYFPKLGALILLRSNYGAKMQNLPPDLLLKLPSLHHLHLDGIGMDWRGSSLSEELVKLEIRQSPPPPSVNDLINFLSNLSNLTSLTLFGCLPTFTEDAAGELGDRRVHLSRLEWLRLGLRHPLELHFLQYVVFPSTTKVVITDLGAPLSDKIFNPSLLSRFILDREGREPFRSLDIAFDRDNEKITLQGWSASLQLGDTLIKWNNLDYDLTRMLGCAHISLVIDLKRGPQYTPSTQIIHDFIIAYLYEAPLQKLETLKLNFTRSRHDTTYGHLSFTEGLKHLPHLKQIILCGGYSMWPLVEHLFTREEGILSELECLVFVDVYFGRASPKDQAGWDTVKEWLEWRMKAQLPRLKYLNFVKCRNLGAPDMSSYDGLLEMLLYHPLEGR